MNLQTILYGQFTPPLGGKVRRHFILQEKGKPLKPYEPPPAKPNLQQECADQMYTYIEENPGCCVKEIQQHMSRTISYVYKLRDILMDQSRITGVRGKPIRRGGPKTTLFYVKD